MKQKEEKKKFSALITLIHLNSNQPQVSPPNENVTM